MPEKVESVVDEVKDWFEVLFGGSGDNGQQQNPGSGNRK